VPKSFPAQDPKLVMDIVGASHGRIERVRELLSQAPQLANAAWDWGFGDWETALGAASHVGNRAIAELLIAHGARPDLFTFAMLGRLDAVRAIIASQSGIERLRGPHGLTLMHHARAGGEPAAAVVAYLADLPGADEPPTDVPLAEEDRARILGEYRWGEGMDERLRVFLTERQKRLAVTGADGSPRGLLHLGDFTFHPVGAPDVRIRFTFDGQRVQGVHIATPAILLEATRVE
jgi:hypothetical protein